jgi:hypothetical protein
MGYHADEPSGLGPRGTVYRFRRDGGTVDVLGPDGLRRGARTLGESETIQVKGGTQALKRTEKVVVHLDARRATMRCPDILGAVLLKARAVEARRQDEDLSDLALLLSLVEDPMEMRRRMTATEARWLRSAGERLSLDDSELRRALPADELTRAGQALALLVAT